MKFRSGIGFDIHPYEQGRELWLGGVMVPFHKGLEGFSDADVLLHAIIDALLGAAGLGDIGMHFPAGNPAYHRISSLRLLDQTENLISAEGWKIENIDCMVITQEPKIGPYREMMREQIALGLRLPAAHVNVKAVSPEGLGFIGRVEGIASQAIALLSRS